MIEVSTILIPTFRDNSIYPQHDLNYSEILSTVNDFEIFFNLNNSLFIPQIIILSFFLN